MGVALFIIFGFLIFSLLLGILARKGKEMNLFFMG